MSTPAARITPFDPQPGELVQFSESRLMLGIELELAEDDEQNRRQDGSRFRQASVSGQAPLPRLETCYAGAVTGRNLYHFGVHNSSDVDPFGSG